MCEYAETDRGVTDGLCRFKFIAGEGVLCVNRNPGRVGTVQCEDAGKQLELVRKRWKRATKRTEPLQRQ